MSLDALEIKVSSQEFSRRIEEWAIESGTDMPAALRKQSRLFLLQCIKITPPRKGKGERPTTDGQAETARKEAAQRIQRSLRKVFSVGGTGFVENIAKVHGASNINAWLTREDDVRVNLQWGKILFNGDEMRAFHYKQTVGKGDRFKFRTTWRVWKGSKTKGARWQAQAVAGKQDFDKYLATVQNHLGRMRAAWVKGYYAIGGASMKDFRVPNWVEQHVSGARGAVDVSRLTGNNPSVTIHNFSRGVRMIKNTIPFVLKVRMAAMKTDMRMYIEGKKKRFEK